MNVKCASLAVVDQIVATHMLTGEHLISLTATLFERTERKLLPSSIRLAVGLDGFELDS